MLKDLLEKNTENIVKEKPNKSRFWSGILFFSISIILIFVVLLFALSFASVQDWGADKIAKRLSEKLQTELTIGKFEVNIFKDVKIEDVYLEGLDQDTLLYIDRIDVNLRSNLLSLLSNELDVKDVSIDGAYINLDRQENEAYFNIQKMLSLFKEEDDGTYDPNKTEIDSTKTPLSLDLNSLDLKDVRFISTDKQRGQITDVYVDEATINFNEIVLDSFYFSLSDVKMKNGSSKITFMEPAAFEAPAPTETANVNVDLSPESIPSSFNPLLIIEKIDVENHKFKISDLRKEPKPFKQEHFDAGYFTMEEINLDIADFKLEDYVLSSRLNDVKMEHKESPFGIESFSSDKMRLTNKQLSFSNFELQSHQSYAKDSIQLNFREFHDFSDFNNKIRISSEISESQIGVKEVLLFIPELQENAFFKKNLNESINLKGVIKGKVNNLRSNDLELRIGNKTYISGDFNSRNITVKGEEVVNISFKELSTDVQTLHEIIPGFSLPENYFKLGKIKFNGRFDGFFNDFVTYGNFNTDLGSAKMDMRLDLKGGKSSATYSGTIAFNEFDVGQFVDNEDLGLLTMTASVKEGEGLNPETMSAKLGAEVSSFPFRDYTYKNFSLDGELERNRFDGIFEIEDENIDMNFEGAVFIIDEEPIFDMIANIHHLDLQALGFSEETLQFSGYGDVNISGSDIDDINGLASMVDMKIVTAGNNTYELDSFYLEALPKLGYEKDILISSDILDAKLDGQFKFRDMLASMLWHLKENYPAFTEAIKPNRTQPEIEKVNFSYDVKIKDSKNFLSLFDLPFENVKDASLKGNYNSTGDFLKADFYLGRYDYYPARFNDLEISLSETPEGNFVNIKVDKTEMQNNFEINPVLIQAKIDNDIIEFDINTEDLTDAFESIHLKGKLEKQGEFFDLKLAPSNLKMLENEWTISEGNYVRMGKKYIDIKNFDFTSSDKKISLHSIANKGVELNVQGFDVAYVNELSNIKKIIISGPYEINISAPDIFEDEQYYFHAQVPNLIVNNDSFGLADANFKLASLSEAATGTLSLNNGTSALLAEGKFWLPLKNIDEAMHNHLDFKIDATDYPVAILEYFLQDGITETEGYADAEFTVKGPIQDPVLNGIMKVNEASTKVAYLGTRYFINNQQIKLSSEIFDLSNTVFTDELGNKATVFGGILHHNFQDMRMNITVNSPKILGLKTTKTDNELFYGYGLGSVVAKFTGPTSDILMDIYSETARGTQLTIPVDYDKEASDLSFIEFVTTEEKEIEEIEESAYTLKMNLIINEDATTEIIFDEQAGDKILGFGKGNIQIDINPSGDFNMYGDYLIEGGEYLFTTPYLINKPFEVKKGGTINWIGDPYNAEINIQAEYRGAKPSLKGFLEEYLVNATPDLRQEASQSTELILYLNLTEQLLEPKIDFDLEFPNVTGELKAYVDSKVNILKSNENRLNNQVFGLMLFGTFLPSENPLGNEQIFAGGINTVGEFFSSQLSLFLNDLLEEALTDIGFISGVDFDIAYSRSSYSNDLNVNQQTTTNYDEFELRMKNYLFNDRLILDFGGNYVSNSPFTSGSYFTNDSSLDYLLTPEGNLKIRVYHKNQLTVESGRKNKYGVGLSYSQDFDTFEELKSNLKNIVSSSIESRPKITE